MWFGCPTSSLYKIWLKQVNDGLESWTKVYSSCWFETMSTENAKNKTKIANFKNIIFPKLLDVVENVWTNRMKWIFFSFCWILIHAWNNVQSLHEQFNVHQLIPDYLNTISVLANSRVSNRAGTASTVTPDPQFHSHLLSSVGNSTKSSRSHWHLEILNLDFGWTSFKIPSLVSSYWSSFWA